MRLRTPGRRPSVLFAGQSYYHAWYLSRELRKLGWRADVLNWNWDPETQGFYHGQDYQFTWDPRRGRRHLPHLAFYLRSLPRYDIFHFSNTQGIRFGHPLHKWVADRFHPYAEVELLRRLGKKIVYSNNGCLDGVSQTSFASWGDTPVCWTARGASARTSAATSATSIGATTVIGSPTSSARQATIARTTTTTSASTKCPSSTAWTQSSGAPTSRSRSGTSSIFRPGP